MKNPVDLVEIVIAALLCATLGVVIVQALLTLEKRRAARLLNVPSWEHDLARSAGDWLVAMWVDEISANVMDHMKYRLMFPMRRKQKLLGPTNPPLSEGMRNALAGIVERGIAMDTVKDEVERRLIEDALSRLKDRTSRHSQLGTVLPFGRKIARGLESTLQPNATVPKQDFGSAGYLAPSGRKRA